MDVDRTKATRCCISLVHFKYYKRGHLYLTRYLRIGQSNTSTNKCREWFAVGKRVYTGLVPVIDEIAILGKKIVSISGPNFVLEMWNLVEQRIRIATYESAKASWAVKPSWFGVVSRVRCWGAANTEAGRLKRAMAADEAIKNISQNVYSRFQIEKNCWKGQC